MRVSCSSRWACCDTTKFNGEAEVWDRRDRSVSIGPVVAGSGAAYRWSLTKQAPPPSPQGISDQLEAEPGGSDAPDWNNVPL